MLADILGILLSEATKLVLLLCINVHSG